MDAVDSTKTDLGKALQNPNGVVKEAADKKMRRRLNLNPQLQRTKVFSQGLRVFLIILCHSSDPAMIEKLARK